MARTLSFLALLVLTAAHLSAQQMDKADRLIKEGIELFDVGRYREAIGKYDEALKLDPSNAVALYEKAYSYYTLKDNDTALSVLKPLLQRKDSSGLNAAILYGTILDMQGMYDDCVAVYKAALDVFPDNYLLHYNLAIAHHGRGKVAEAESEFAAAFEKNPRHQSSLKGLFLSECTLQNRGRAFLAASLLLHFVDGRTRGQIRDSLFSLIEGSTSDNNITINPDDDEFVASLDLLLSLTWINLSSRGIKDKAAQFLEIMKTGIDVCGELAEKNGDLKNGFWGKTFAGLFLRLKEKGRLERYIELAAGDKAPAAYTDSEKADYREITVIMNSYFNDIAPEDKVR